MNDVDTRVGRDTHTQDKYRNPPAHVGRGLIICLPRYKNAYYTVYQEILSVILYQPEGLCNITSYISDKAFVGMFLCIHAHYNVGGHGRS